MESKIYWVCNVPRCKNEQMYHELRRQRSDDVAVVYTNCLDFCQNGECNRVDVEVDGCITRYAQTGQDYRIVRIHPLDSIARGAKSTSA